MSKACLEEEFLSAFAQGALDQSESQKAEEHIDSCRDCSSLVAMLAQLVTHSQGGASAAEAESLLAAGHRIGRFVVVKLAGRGAMSVVYEAYDADLDRNVAIKLLRASDHGQIQPRRAARMLTEARTLARLNHENVVVVHEVGTHEGRVFIAMEFVEGTTLSQWIEQHSPSRSEILDVFVKAGQGLHAAHTAGLVHRDFKPDNVLIGNDGRVRVSDFGLAQNNEALSSEMDDLEIRQTHTGECVGTPAYMAPEQWQGQADSLSDQFSFCVALFEALTGSRPFIGTDIKQILTAAMAGQITGAVSPGWLHRLLVRGLSPEPEERFVSTKALLAALAAGRGARRKSALVAGSVLALSIAVLAGSALIPAGTQSPSQACAGVGHEASEVWQEGKGQVRAMVLQDPFGEAAWQQVDSLFSRYSQQWASSRIQICEQSNQAEPVQERMQSCLEDGLEDFRAVVGVLSEGESISASASVKAAGRMSPPAFCTDSSRVAHRRPRSTANPANKTELARARALQQTGQFEASLAVSTPLAERAKAEGDRETEVISLFVSCGSAANLGRLKEGKAFCHKAAMGASVPGFARERAQAWAMLVGLVGGREANFEEAQLWAGYAQAAIDELGSAHGLESMLNAHLGIAAKQQGQNAKARMHYLRALELLREAPPVLHKGLEVPEDTRLAPLLNNLAILEGKMGEREASEEHHLQALQIKKKIYGPTHPSVAVSLLNLGILHATADPETAMSFYQQSLAIMGASLAPNHPYLGSLLVSMSNAERRLGALESARAHLVRAEKGFISKYGAEHPRVAATVEGIALLFQQQEEHSKALTLHERALAIRTASYSEPHEDVASSHLNIGLVLINLDRFTEAKEHLTKGLEIRRATLGDTHHDTAWDLMGLGIAERSLGHTKVSLRLLEEARGLLLASDDRDQALHADVALNIAVTLAELGKPGPRAHSLANEALLSYQSLPGESEHQGVASAREWLAAH